MLLLLPLLLLRLLLLLLLPPRRMVHDMCMCEVLGGVSVQTSGCASLVPYRGGGGCFLGGPLITTLGLASFTERPLGPTGIWLYPLYPLTLYLRSMVVETRASQG